MIGRKKRVRRVKSTLKEIRLEEGKKFVPAMKKKADGVARLEVGENHHKRS